MAKKLHQDGRYRLYQCRGGNTSDSWHVTTMGAWATMRYKDWEANGYQPYEAMNDFPPLEGA